MENMTHEELVAAVQELQAFKDEWTPFLVSLLQSLVAMSRNPMFAGMAGTFLPPQAQSLLAQLG